MSCALTGGRQKPCKDAVGGIKKIYFVDFGGLNDITTTNDEVTDADGTFNYHRYDVKGNSSLDFDSEEQVWVDQYISRKRNNFL